MQQLPELAGIVLWLGWNLGDRPANRWPQRKFNNGLPRHQEQNTAADWPELPVVYCYSQYDWPGHSAIINLIGEYQLCISCRVRHGAN